MKKLFVVLAMFAGVMRVSADIVTSAGDIQMAIDAAALESPAGTVTLGIGTFIIDSQLNVTGGVTLVGAGWDKTTIKPQSGKTIRCAYLDDGATVEGMTLTGGKAAYGSGAWVKDGTVSWCRIIKNNASDNGEFGVGVSFTDGHGHVDHCVIADNSGRINTCGIGIGATAPTGAITIDTCLIYGNKTWTTTGSGAAIGIYNHDFDCTVRNCTIVGNTSRLPAAVYRETGNGKLILINDIVAGNFLTEAGGGSEANVKNVAVSETKNCLFGLASEILPGMTGCLSGDPRFVDAENGDYRLQDDSPAKSAGIVYAGIGKDLAGKNFHGKKPSMGCYEIKQQGTLISLR